MQRLAARPPAVDVALALTLAVVGLLETGLGGLRWLDQWLGDPGVNTVVVTASTLTLAWRRAAPIGVLCVVLGALAAWFAGRRGAVDPTITSREVVASQRPHLH